MFHLQNWNDQEVLLQEITMIREVFYKIAELGFLLRKKSKSSSNLKTLILSENASYPNYNACPGSI